MLLLLFFLLFSFASARYHLTDEILQSVRKECEAVQELTCSEHHGILVVDWKKELKHDQFYNFNEHARERITGELALKLIKSLKIIKPKRRITILPISNIDGRRHAENGAPCQRKNSNGVDINRNFQMTSTKHKYARWSEEYEGAHPLSEKESQLIASILKKGVKRYVNVHSGEYSLYCPYDSTLQKPKNQKTMLKNLKEWGKFCSVCTVGSAAEKSSYKAYGTSVDFATHIGVPEAYTFEIFGQKGSCEQSFNPVPKRMKFLLKRWMRIFRKVIAT